MIFPFRERDRYSRKFATFSRSQNWKAPPGGHALIRIIHVVIPDAATIVTACAVLSTLRRIRDVIRANIHAFSSRLLDTSRADDEVDGRLSGHSKR